MAPSVPELIEPARIVLKGVIMALANAGLIDGHAATLLLAILKLEDA